MPAFNVVKFRVQPGQDEAFLDAHLDGKATGQASSAAS